MPASIAKEIHHANLGKNGESFPSQKDDNQQQNSTADECHQA
jgi:hypothetical protein